MTTVHTAERKKIIRAKRSLPLNRYIPVNNNDLPQLEITWSNEEKSNIIHHQIKRIKKVHKSECDHDVPLECVNNDSIAKPSIKPNIRVGIVLFKPWITFLMFLIVVFLYSVLSNETDIDNDSSRLTSFVQHQSDPLYVVSQRFKELSQSINSNIISRYGQFVQNRFFSLLDLLVTLMGQIFFHIDKYECKNNIAYVATSTFEHVYDWCMDSFKR